jgi:hypothetical protein
MKIKPKPMKMKRYARAVVAPWFLEQQKEELIQGTNSGGVPISPNAVLL